MYARNRSGTRLHNPERLHIEDNSKSSLFKNAQKAQKLLQLYSVSNPEISSKGKGPGQIAIMTLILKHFQCNKKMTIFNQCRGDPGIIKIGPQYHLLVIRYKLFPNC